jgi:alpha-glucosidase
MTALESAQRTLLGSPHHDGSELYVVDAPDELGGEATVRLRTRTGEAGKVLLRYTQDGEPRTTAATVDEERDGETWWRATFPVTNPATRYRWLLAGGEAGYAWVTGAGVAPHEVAGADDYVVTPGSTGPAWHLESVVYEIFPDRFAASGAAHEPPEWAVRKRWDELPVGRGKDNPREWFGGDLAGIEQHLDHIERVGANAIYLTPIFPAGSTHRYDATTFDRVDPLLGGDEALAALVRASKQRGIRLIGDITPNHVGVKHDWFVAAHEDAHATERGFFYFDDALPHGYESWLGVPSLPKLDWRSDELRARMGDVLRHWLDAGLSGWRVDVANMTGRFRAVDVNREAARFMRSVTGSLLVAEHGHDFRNDLDGTGWHGAMNYAGFLRPTWWWLRGEDYDQDVFSQAPSPRYGGAEMTDVMRRFRAGVPWDCVLHSWPLLDSHDTPRFRTVVGSRERQLVGVGLQMTTPGVPMVFMGDELGMEGRWGEDARRPMPWGSFPDDLVDTYGRLARLRRTSRALVCGGIRYVHASADAVAYLRETREETLLCLAARAGHEPITTPFTSLETLYGEEAREGVLPSHGPAFHIWRIH